MTISPEKLIARAGHKIALYKREITRLEDFIFLTGEFSEEDREPHQEDALDAQSEAQHKEPTPLVAGNQADAIPALNPETLPSTDKSQEGEAEQKGTTGSETGLVDSSAPLRRSLGVSAMPPDSPQAKAGHSHQLGSESQAKTSADNDATDLKPTEQAGDSVAGEVSRPDEGRSSSATSEIMGATVGGDESGTAPIRRKKGELTDQVIAAHDANPKWTATQVADHVGCFPTDCYKIAKKAGFQFPKREKSPTPKLPPKRKAKTERPPPTPPATTNKLPAYHTSVPKPARQKGQQFFLRQQAGSGKYLHESGQCLVDGKANAWHGSQQQLVAARKTFKAAVDLVEVAIIQ